ncbi:MAG TPA: sigma-70 family RNA polymerase sigma factor [Balneolaceae bacterium]|nr:sigma-70 family RNA polymerase sigma factor [Balneolaceae bacterium]
MTASKNSNKQTSDSHRENASQSSLEDDKLVELAIGGDEGAYKKLTDKYRKALNFHIMKMIKNREQIEDLVQETFVKAFDNLNTYNTNYAFSTWIYRIATNHTIDYLRKKKLQTVSMDETIKTKSGEMEMQFRDESAGTDRNIIRKQRQTMVRNAIDGLPEKYRRVIEMRHMEEKSYQEIAELLDLPLGTVKAHIFRARELLYKALKDKKEQF